MARQKSSHHSRQETRGREEERGEQERTCLKLDTMEVFTPGRWGQVLPRSSSSPCPWEPLIKHCQNAPSRDGLLQTFLDSPYFDIFWIFKRNSYFHHDWKTSKNPTGQLQEVVGNWADVSGGSVLFLIDSARTAMVLRTRRRPGRFKKNHILWSFVLRECQSFTEVHRIYTPSPQSGKFQEA